MIYLFSTDLKENKQVSRELEKIYGLSKTTSSDLCKKLGLSPTFLVLNLSNEQFTELIKCIESLNLIIAGDLLKLKLLTINRFISIKSYKGIRRKRGLPVRGQRTHTNAKTAKKIS
jgi:small subunit ribosomal protein S13